MPFYLFLVLLWRSGFWCVLPVPVLLCNYVFAFSAEVEVNVTVCCVCVHNFCLLYCTALGAFYCFGVCHGWLVLLHRWWAFEPIAIIWDVVRKRWKCLI